MTITAVTADPLAVLHLEFCNQLSSFSFCRRDNRVIRPLTNIRALRCDAAFYGASEPNRKITICHLFYDLASPIADAIPIYRRAINRYRKACFFLA